MGTSSPWSWTWPRAPPRCCRARAPPASTARRAAARVSNKTDLAPHVGADLSVMERDARKMRGDGPFVFTQVTKGVGLQEVIAHLLGAWRKATGATPRT